MMIKPQLLFQDPYTLFFTVSNKTKPSSIHRNGIIKKYYIIAHKIFLVFPLNLFLLYINSVSKKSVHLKKVEPRSLNLVCKQCFKFKFQCHVKRHLEAITILYEAWSLLSYRCLFKVYESVATDKLVRWYSQTAEVTFPVCP